MRAEQDSARASVTASAGTPSGTPADAPDGGHRTSIVERGSFAVARCSCGWKGPARRARDRARRDAEEHISG
ncbi:hypothetical protein ACIO6U_32385 [Streptomyces sp. NPDC087422]|uniref:hypothetical protein n=1 Tax=Streptomyces sp. NPDC087422 TaxID=3365786 RepID=UPI00381A6630